MTSSTQSPQFLPALSRSDVVARDIGRHLVALMIRYLMLAAFNLYHLHYFRTRIVETYDGLQFHYDPAYESTYLAACLLSPLVLLLAPRRFDKPAWLFVLCLYVIFYVPFLVTNIGKANVPVATGIWLFTTAMVLLCASSAIRLPWSPPKTKGRAIRVSIYIVCGLTILVLVPLAIRSPVTGLAGDLTTSVFDEASALRGTQAIPLPIVYLINFFVYVFGPLLAAWGAMERRYFFLIIYVLGGCIAFLVLPEKTMFMGAVLVIGMIFAHRAIGIRSINGLIALLLAPFLAAPILENISPVAHELLDSYVNMRMYYLNGHAYEYYVDFFSWNPHTRLSHINVMRLFTPYPYDGPIPAILNDTYRLGNFNSVFWLMDGIAGFGFSGVLPVTIAAGLLLILLNSAARGLDPVFVAIVTSVVAIRLTSDSLATTLLTGGLGLTIAILSVLPRSGALGNTR